MNGVVFLINQEKKTYLTIDKDNFLVAECYVLGLSAVAETLTQTVRPMLVPWRLLYKTSATKS